MKNGFKVMDSDLHTMEPDGLWERYLDETSDVDLNALALPF